MALWYDCGTDGGKLKFSIDASVTKTVSFLILVAAGQSITAPDIITAT